MILESARPGATKTKIMYKAYLSYTQLNQYISFLIENKLIEHKPGTEIYTLTKKGIRVLSLYKELEDMIPLKKEQTNSSILIMKDLIVYKRRQIP